MRFNSFLRSKINLKRVIVVITITLLLIIFNNDNISWALQNTINMPNSEVLPQGNVLLKEVDTNYPNKDLKTNTNIPSINYGVGHNTEVSLGVPLIMNFPDSSVKTTIKMAIEAKHVFYPIEDYKNTRIIFGGGVFPYLNGGTTEGFFYAHITQIINKTKTNLSLGGYSVGDKEFINSGGMLMMLEQGIPKTDKIKLVSEYTTGRNSRSNFAVGIKYKPVKDFAITGAVILPNHSNDYNTNKNIGFEIILSKFLCK